VGVTLTSDQRLDHGAPRDAHDVGGNGRDLIGKSKGEWAGLSARRHAVVSVNVVDGCGN